MTETSTNAEPSKGLTMDDLRAVRDELLHAPHPPCGPWGFDLSPLNSLEQEIFLKGYALLMQPPSEGSEKDVTTLQATAFSRKGRVETNAGGITGRTYLIVSTPDGDHEYSSTDRIDAGSYQHLNGALLHFDRYTFTDRGGTLVIAPKGDV